MRVQVIVGMLLGIAGVSFAADPDLRAEILGVDHARVAAMLAAERSALEALLDDDLSYTHSNGHTESKASLIESLVSGRVDYLEIDAPQRSVRIRGDVAIVSGPVRIAVAAVGRVHRLSSVFTAVYLREAGHWQLVAYQSTPAAVDAPTRDRESPP